MSEYDESFLQELAAIRIALQQAVDELREIKEKLPHQPRPEIAGPR